MLQKHIIKVTKKLIDFVRYLLEHKDNNNFYTKAEADCYQRFINSVTQKNINEMLHYLRQYGGDLKNYYTVPNYFLVDYSFYPGWSLFYFDKQFNPDLLKFFGIDLNEFKYLFSKYEELSDTDQTRRYRQKKFLAFCFALSWVEAVKILAYEENNQKAKEYLNLIEFREFCSNDKSAGNLFNKLVERVKAQNIPANYLDASYCPTSIRFDRYMYFIDNSIIITREDNNPKQGNKKANKAGLTQSPAPAPAVVDNVMTLEPYDENFTAFTGDFSDLDISASLNDWEAGGYSEPENKNKITAINDNVDDFYFKYVNWDLFNKSVNIFRPFWEKSNKISALDSGRRLYETFTELFKYVFQAFTAFANIKGVNFWDIFAEIAHIYDNDNTDISAIANLYGINLFKIYDKMYKFKPEHEIHNFKDMLNYHSYDENNVIKFKICNILANIWMYYINHAELHKDINFISEPLEIEKAPKKWEKIARLCAIVREHEIFSKKINACKSLKLWEAYKWDEAYLTDPDATPCNYEKITMLHNLFKQYYNVCDHFDQNKDRWIIENKINLRYLYEKSIHNEKDIILFFGPYLYADQKITNLRNLCKNVLALDCKGLKSKDDYLNMLENILKGFKHPHKENIKFNLDDLKNVKEPELKKPVVKTELTPPAPAVVVNNVTTRKTEIKELKDVTSVKNEKICVNNQLFFNFDTVVTNEPKIKKTVVNPEIITPAPAVVDNVMTLEPYDEDFTAFTGDYSDLDISASLNDWEAGGYSKTENKNEVTAPKFEIIKALDENYFNLVFDESKIKDVEKFKFNLALYYSLLPLIEEGNYYLLNYSERFKDFKKIRAKLSEIIGTDAYKCGLIPMSWLKGAHLLKHIDQLDMQHYRNIAKFLGLNTKGLKRKKDYFLLVQSIVNHEDYLIFLKEEKEFFNNCVIGVSVNAMEIIDERKKNNVTMPA